MITYKLVMPENLNTFGDLFGGNMLKWVDETAAMAVLLDFPGCRFLTIGMDKVVFKRPVKCGSILKFDINQVREGKTSVSYSVIVADPHNAATIYFTTIVTFVHVNKQMQKIALQES